MRWLELGIRAVLLGAIFLFQMIIEPNSFPIIELCIAVIYCALYLLTENLGVSKRYLIYFSLFFLTSIFLPELYLFWPLIFYDYSLQSYKNYSLFLLPLLLGLGTGVSIYISFFITSLCWIASIIHTVIDNSQTFEKASFEEIDTLRFLNQRIKNEQDSLLHLQDEKVNSSRLQERRRIVEEIHDLLGHQLSSAIIQIGALEYLATEPEVKSSLTQVKEVLSTSMNNVRTVIHTERQTTVNLEEELRILVRQFSKCPISFHYKNYALIDNQTAHSIVNIVKEALTNINKHSTATSVQVRFTEVSHQWTLLIADNGTVSEYQMKHPKGIGLLNIEERVSKMNGNIHINYENGFRIFVVIPKKGEAG